jgi:type III protein arginine methyltransferase
LCSILVSGPLFSCCIYLQLIQSSLPGTGTGILSMMAVSLGAGTVYACEAFEPMADCATKIIAANGMADRITVIAKRSTSLKIGVDMPRRANILVTEVFDTELIGEGAMKTFSHAHEHLLEPGCVVVPSSARMFVQVVESPFCMAWNLPKLLPNLDGDILIRTPPAIQQCNGSQLLHDVQLSQMPAHSFTPLSPPIQVFDFDWSGRTKLKFDRSSVTPFPSLAHGQPHAVFMWWDLNMDEKGEVLLSCAPYWAHPDFETLKAKAQAPVREQNIIPWRDHWMQAVYFLPPQVKMCQEGSTYRLLANHDEFSLWFGLTEEQDPKSSSEDSRCECGFHMTYSRTRIGQLNSSWRTKKFMKLLEDTITESSTVLVLSEGSLLGLVVAAQGARIVYALEPNRLSRAAMEAYIDHNKLENVKILEKVSEVSDGVTHVFAEPHFNQSILPWDNFYFGTLLQQCRPKLASDAQIIPGKAVIRAVAVHFLDLHKIQAVCKLRECHGFNMEIFDTLMEKATNLTDSNVEAQPLWEYPCVAISKAVDLLTVNFEDFGAKQEISASIEFDE